MDTAAAYQLSYKLRRAARPGKTHTYGMKLRADVEGDRIVFSGGKQGPHSLAVDVSSEARILAHWEGYCENNGLPRPMKDQKVFFVGATGKTYLGTVTKVGTKRVYLDFNYRHGGAGHAIVPIGEIVYQ